MRVIVIFAKSVKEDNKEILQKFVDSYLRNGLRDLFQI